MNHARKNAISNGLKHYEGNPCKKCGTTKKYTICRGCVRCAKTKNYNRYKKDPEKWLAYNRTYTKKNAYSRKRNLANKFNLTLEQYDEMFKSQNGVCAICQNPTMIKIERRLAVDHDHSTGKVRGLLCDHCNRGLGFFKDNIDNLYKAIKYLDQNSAV